MLDMFSLLVACRKGEYTPPPRLAHRISPLPVSEPLDDVSASEVRNRIREGRPWQDLVPAEIEHQVRAYYGG
jgi:nicotinic acid mononucleotide adenylyltransferase